MIRQGDVLLVSVKSIPKDAQRNGHNGRIVLAEGEVTGHAHTIDSTEVQVYERDGVMYLKVGKAVQLVHQEHEMITIQPGRYMRVGQMEWSDAREPRRVID